MNIAHVIFILMITLLTLISRLVHDSSDPAGKLTCTLPQGTSPNTDIIVVASGGSVSLTQAAKLGYVQCEPGTYQVGTELTCGDCEAGTYIHTYIHAYTYIYIPLNVSCI